MSGKHYPYEFKIEAVKQVVDRCYSVSSVATRHDITTHNLYAWIKKYAPDPYTNKEQSDAQAGYRSPRARKDEGSMNRRGNCDENAVEESFFHLLKHERIN